MHARYLRTPRHNRSSATHVAAGVVGRAPLWGTSTCLSLPYTLSYVPSSIGLPCARFNPPVTEMKSPWLSSKVSFRLYDPIYAIQCDNENYLRTSTLPRLRYYGVWTQSTEVKPLAIARLLEDAARCTVRSSGISPALPDMLLRHAGLPILLLIELSELLGPDVRLWRGPGTQTGPPERLWRGASDNAVHLFNAVGSAAQRIQG